GMMAQGYAFAYLPVLGFAYLTQRKKSVWIFIFAAWVAILTLLSRGSEPFDDFRVYLWLGLGSTALCWWGVRANRKLFINYGTAGFALTVIGFYFSSVMDKMGRAIGLISLGLIFLLGGWVLNRLRTDLIARAAAGSGGAK
ncbi:MAG TPA: DUF2157 domain-containing protein, partial [Alphaproteobacteria bacterium]|nr:DUF2157 domain-containing protein [Alphaproteobacteria bacterium]